MAPKATMLERPPSIAEAISLIASPAWRGELHSSAAGASPSAGSPISRLFAMSGISAANLEMFSQSMATSKWKLSSWDAIGSVAKRIMAAGIGGGLEQ